MARIILACALLALAGAVRTDFNDSLFDVGVHRFLEEQGLGRAACGAEVANPGSGLVEYFDGMRVEMGLLDSVGQPDAGLADPAKCSKKDICLLMRQLDMDFYQRAREGKLTESDYNSMPPAHVVKSGNCASANRGYKLRPIMSGKRCKQVAKAHEIPVPKQGTKLERINEGNPMKPLPEGCIVVKGQVKMNNAGFPQAKAGLAYTDGGAKQEVWQLCEMDRSLTESAAAYYSPYKLKENMVGREAMSTSCSFGMYAFLARLKLTNSHCARILTYKTSNKFKDAAQAQKLAKSLEKTNLEGSKTIMKYVESIRQKYVLMNLVANEWCPAIWTTAQATQGSTCAAARTMAWTAEAQELAQATTAVKKDKETHASKFGPSKYAGNQELLDALDAVLAGLSEEDGRSIQLTESIDNAGDASSSDRPDKIALTTQACEAIDDALLSDALKGQPEAPPDFFRAAALEEEE